MLHGPSIGSRREPARGHHMAFFESHSFQQDRTSPPISSLIKTRTTSPLPA